jgi:hypothetical protein
LTIGLQAARCSEGDGSPWYPTARQFRQDESRDWGNVIACVAAALHDYVRGFGNQ